MEDIDYEEEEQICSEASKHNQEVQHFKEYLVSSGTIQHFVKFLFGLRTKQEHDESVPNPDALEMFREYFGALTPDTSQQDEISKEIAAVRTANDEMVQQIETLKAEIGSRRERLETAREEKRLREEQQARNPKKGTKK